IDGGQDAGQLDRFPRKPGVPPIDVVEHQGRPLIGFEHAAQSGCGQLTRGDHGVERPEDTRLPAVHGWRVRVRGGGDCLDEYPCTVGAFQAGRHSRAEPAGLRPRAQDGRTADLLDASPDLYRNRFPVDPDAFGWWRCHTAPACRFAPRWGNGIYAPVAPAVGPDNLLPLLR